MAQNIISGTPGRDQLVGTEGDDLINGLTGKDHLHGLAGDDVLHGGLDNDMFAEATRNAVALLAAGTLALASFLCAVYVGVRGAKESSFAKKALRKIYEHRVWFAVASSVLALAPLLAGAAVSISKPTRFADAGTLLIVLVGVAAIATLFGVVLVTVPLAFNRPALGAVAAAIMCPHSQRRWLCGPRRSTRWAAPARSLPTTPPPMSPPMHTRTNCAPNVRWRK